jgi:hypothetical protein
MAAANPRRTPDFSRSAPGHPDPVFWRRQHPTSCGQRLGRCLFPRRLFAGQESGTMDTATVQSALPTGRTGCHASHLVGRRPGADSTGGCRIRGKKAPRFCQQAANAGRHTARATAGALPAAERTPGRGHRCRHCRQHGGLCAGRCRLAGHGAGAGGESGQRCLMQPGRHAAPFAERRRQSPVAPDPRRLSGHPPLAGKLARSALVRLRRAASGTRCRA